MIQLLKGLEALDVEIEAKAKADSAELRRHSGAMTWDSTPGRRELIQGSSSRWPAPNLEGRMDFDQMIANGNLVKCECHDPFAVYGTRDANGKGVWYKETEEVRRDRYRRTAENQVRFARKTDETDDEYNDRILELSKL